ncbi:hypothetical protein COF68_05535 [Bacillus toyonensis]|uniref:hypothetical protein n=1 Tax=Bacillus toyonensis TaxID=155322 RepID=UPI000BFD3C77|nr:hypothetical protein [Bacillus toyonensis]PHE64305.1 hypothetical protein COF68_05535 [Bacillus toyonensis]
MFKPYCVRTNMRRWTGEELTTSPMKQKTYETHEEAQEVADELNKTHKHLLNKDDRFFYASFC